MYLLDTNVCINILNGTNEPLLERMREHNPSELRLSVVVKAELLFGARYSNRPGENLALLTKFFKPFIKTRR
ncbi:MAG: type II toxin-antitoxin system VapC family toxin [Deltaproteobacteria bacterium]|nr:type II toxin-antitoxin system VapC family toxin [Deltaproteobacteria bacterium]